MAIPQHPSSLGSPNPSSLGSPNPSSLGSPINPSSLGSPIIRDDSATESLRSGSSGDLSILPRNPLLKQIFKRNTPEANQITKPKNIQFTSEALTPSKPEKVILFNPSTKQFVFKNGDEETDLFELIQNEFAKSQLEPNEFHRLSEVYSGKIGQLNTFMKTYVELLENPDKVNLLKLEITAKNLISTVGVILNRVANEELKSALNGFICDIEHSVKSIGFIYDFVNGEKNSLNKPATELNELLWSGLTLLTDSENESVKNTYLFFEEVTKLLGEYQMSDESDINAKKEATFALMLRLARLSEKYNETSDVPIVNAIKDKLKEFCFKIPQAYMECEEAKGFLDLKLQLENLELKIVDCYTNKNTKESFSNILKELKDIKNQFDTISNLVTNPSFMEFPKLNDFFAAMQTEIDKLHDFPNKENIIHNLDVINKILSDPLIKDIKLGSLESKQFGEFLEHLEDIIGEVESASLVEGLPPQAVMNLLNVKLHLFMLLHGLNQ